MGCLPINHTSEPQTSRAEHDWSIHARLKHLRTRVFKKKNVHKKKTNQKETVSSPQTSKEDEPALVLNWASRRIWQENSEVRALRMVFLRNALLWLHHRRRGCRFGSRILFERFLSREGKTREEKTKLFFFARKVSRRVGPRAKCVGGFTVFSITGNLRESEFVCVFIHDVADRRGATFCAARSETKKKQRAAPFEPPLVFVFVFVFVFVNSFSVAASPSMSPASFFGTRRRKREGTR